MNKNVLVLLSSNAQKRFFQDLKSKYRLIFVLIDKNKSPLTNIQVLKTKLKDDRLMIDAVVPVNDKTSVIASLLVQEFNLIGSRPLAVCQAQHKGIATKIFEELGLTIGATTYLTPANFMQNLNLLDYPVFYKPVKGSLSINAGFAHSATVLQKVLIELFNQDSKYLSWYKQVFQAYLPSGTKTNAFVIQPVVKGRQFTADGFIYQHQVFFTGITESIMHDQFYSFKRFDFPAQLPFKLLAKLKTGVQDFAQQLDFNNSAFNVEFFVTPAQKLHFIEFNTRLSFQFTPLFNNYYQTNYLTMLIKLALGEKPTLKKQPNLKKTSCCILRSKTDRFVNKIPSKSELKRLTTANADLLGIRVFVKENHYLSESIQDSYSYRYASLDIQGEDFQQINKKFIELKPQLDACFGFR
ncbi:MAG: ATP-grasp domain-containing protein [Candidatus Pacebacteria bacterium]|nr:ATP-grasp domain-containing protein [Candidatus Paceibacterota bacterium]